MHLLIFRTNIKTKKLVKKVKPVFNNLPTIRNWSVDTEDIDNVLRVEAVENLNETDLIHLLKSCGFHGELLQD